MFLDIDGTLLDLAPTPSSVRVDLAVASLLPALAYRLGGAVALITGRTIADADQLFRGIVLPVAGQHGLERRGTDGTLHVHGEGPPGYGWLRGELMHLVERHGGLWLEDKGATLALHYRAAPRLASFVHRTARRLVATSAAAGADWRLQPGKGIVEVKPAGRDKGAAILDFMAEATFLGRLPVFVGDDQTDEYGFAAVALLGGWAVKVGPGSPRPSTGCATSMPCGAGWRRCCASRRFRRRTHDARFRPGMDRPSARSRRLAAVGRGDPAG
ncbi:MAG: trehalose-phosphatase [Betaproteobacteria bacterium]|nr:trehalose-phosphatase [Betaproteobacteria bacterium]